MKDLNKMDTYLNKINQLNKQPASLNEGVSGETIKLADVMARMLIGDTKSALTTIQPVIQKWKESNLTLDADYTKEFNRVAGKISKMLNSI